MKHPSIRVRLIAGTGLAMTVVLALSMSLLYRGLAVMLHKEIVAQLRDSAALLAKSSELELGGVVYEWNEALESGSVVGVPGLFEFWDVNSGKSLGSPALQGAGLPLFHGAVGEVVIREISLDNDRPAIAAGLLHFPFCDAETLAAMKERGTMLDPRHFPQVVVVARELAPFRAQMRKIQRRLAATGLGAVLASWAAILILSRRTLGPITALIRRLDARSLEPGGPAPTAPEDLPLELMPLVTAFGRSLERVEAGRERERRFALHAAHELRTPIAGIQAILEQALRRPREADDLNQRIAASLVIAREMGQTVGTLMRITRIRGGLETLQPEPFSPRTLVADIFQERQAQLDEKNLTLMTAAKMSEEVVLRHDPGMFHLIVSILVDNAIRHSPAGSALEYALALEGGRFIFLLENQTAALVGTDLNDLFEPFQRGNAHDSSGAGLGLSLARDGVRAMGGTLAVYLREKNQFVAEFSLPLESE